MKTEILSLLKNTDGYLSGQEMCNRFGVSRTAVWKVINALKEEGYQIASVPKKGYKLLNQPDVLSKSELESRMRTSWAGKTVFYFEETGSTNEEAKRLAAQGAPHGALVVADMQAAGKGRRGRNWISPKGTSIFMSILLKPEFSPDIASRLTLVMALSVAKAIKETAGVDGKIKWPNDIVVDRKKVCGILTEMEVEMDYIHSVVIGVGINVNLEKIPEEIEETATSLALACGHTLIRAEMIERIMYHFEKNYEKFLETEDLSALQDAYNALLVNRDAKVMVLDPKGSFEGTAKGINQKGELIVETEKGTVAVYAGEVSVRGFYGYV